MIFVILGITVLIASFAIALISLIREQNQVSEEEGKKEADEVLQSVKAKKPGRSPEILGRSKTSIAKAEDEDLRQQNPDVETAPREVFPWEVQHQEIEEDELAEERRKVEALRVQLEDLKAAVAKKNEDPLRTEDTPGHIEEKPSVENEIENKLEGSEPGWLPKELSNEPGENLPKTAGDDEVQDQSDSTLSGEIDLSGLRSKNP